MNKYGAKKTELDGQVFDSKGEANRYAELRMLERAGEITNLKTQVEFWVLLPFTYEGKKEQGIRYIADFTYFDRAGNQVVEDFKGHKTEVYRLKRKMLLATHPGIKFVETSR